jgi:hypothetical protein
MFAMENRWRVRSEAGGQGRSTVPFLLAAWMAFAFPGSGHAQLRYTARFALEKQTYLLGEPIFCKFTVENTGAQPFAFSYRLPGRVANPDLESEPRFTIRDQTGRKLADPAPRPCGGVAGSVVYGSVTLPPGQAHSERWLLNEWGRIGKPGRYEVRAERRLPLLSVHSATQQFSERPVAYALALNELRFEATPATEAQLQAAFEPFLKALSQPTSPEASEAALALVTLPRPFLLEKLVALATAPARERRWAREDALAGLARLGSPEALQAILRIARQGIATARGSEEDAPLRAHAVLLLAEKSDRSFIPPLLELLTTAPETLRDDILRALGFFNDPRANQALFEKLHSPRPDDRVNAILGLRNLGSKDAVPALLAMLKDPEARVRQVADFALQGLTGRKSGLSPDATKAESARVADQWHAWWQEHSATFVPVRQPPCRDW